MDTITALIDHSCSRFSTKDAMLHKSGGGWQKTSYGTLGSVSGWIAAGLMQNGFRTGSHAALLAHSSPEWVMSYLGILKAGGVVIPIDRDLKEIELLYILCHSDAEVVFCDHVHLGVLLGMSGELPALRLIVTLDPPTELAGRDLQGDIACRILTISTLFHKTGLAPVSRCSSDIALILYTSGTTGRSKGAMLSHDNIVSNIRGAVAHLKVDEKVHTLSFLPINHVFEQVCGILLPLSIGGKISFCESLKKLGENLAEVRPTFFVGVPAVYRMILDRMMKRINSSMLSRLLFCFPPTRILITSRIREKLGSGTIFVSGGAALDPEVAELLTRLGVTIYQGYGITETSPVISAESGNGARPGTVGHVLSDVEVKIDNPDGELVGEILVRGPNVMQGYFKDSKATEEVLSGGWYRTGDLGSLDRDGFLKICGRVKNLIVTPNGRNVYPEEVENELIKSPYISEAVVYAHKTGAVEEEIRAIIYPNRELLSEYAERAGKESLSDRDLQSLLRSELLSACARLAPYKRVKDFIVSQEEFPKTTTRKIKRFEVANNLLKGSLPPHSTLNP
ncbi:MAG TPA: AMP-dependent synthetase [Geobacter sp.]|nr:MAG: AMP-dependent synthetase [Geobacteraceae bacterium GWF2_54_21]HBA73179.1 AMP-dependent synthetase [Geobacter sp.]HCE67563.1 AMP-dependent synthetase [Geobacter sp.]